MPPAVHTHKEIKTILTDLKGKPVLQTGHDEYSVRDSQGQLIHRSINENILLCDKVYWNPTMLQANPPVHIAFCAPCSETGHGVITLYNSKLCTRCGRRVCPRHRKLIDNQWFCERCVNLNKIKSVFRFLFLEKR